MAALVRELHEQGVRQLLIESPQMADWLFDDYVTGGALEPTFELPAFYARQLEAIREFNDTLPANERVHVRLIDVNEEHHGGAVVFADLLGLALQHLAPYDPAEKFLAIDFTDEAGETEAIAAFAESLVADRAALISSWGEDWWERVVEMVEVEQASIGVRAARRGDDSRAVRCH